MIDFYFNAKDKNLNNNHSLIHTTATASHYDNDAPNYDAFNEQASAKINALIEQILHKNQVQTVLDMTCGTGSQVFWLTARGFEVVGSDISTSMLAIAHRKAQHTSRDLQLIEGDMRTLKVGTFDAVLTIFNAIGHLTKDDFEQAMRNIHSNLKDGGLYIFDINNLSYLLHNRNITSLTIDWLETNQNKKCRYIQYSTINQDGILASYTTAIEDCDSSDPLIKQSMQTLQVYSAEQLKDMLERNGFAILEQCGIERGTFDKITTERIVTVAKKLA